ncbi:alpha/beta fold hydrolase [Streptomyces sp. NPDC057682]|uniref:alpha/beta fold hydrolase n=1 Tax=Streptomyces sp. NPDC057682 TaxID=3346210 RepID=UPI0036C05AEF
MRIPAPPGPRRAAALAAVLAVALSTAAAPAAAAPSPATGPAPTVVLVHDAFTGASVWNAVAARLQRRGYPVLAPDTPLRGPAEDSAALRAALARISGPVVLVGHGYGGAVIGTAGADDPKVRALVYIAALMPDRGETLGRLCARFPGGALTEALTRTSVRDTDGTRGTALSLAPGRFHDILAADRPAGTTAALAGAQRPLDAAVFTEPAAEAGWRTVPSWALVATEDRLLPPALERFQAERAGAHTVEVASSHLAPVSRPDTVTGLVLAAAEDTASAARRPVASARTLVLAAAGCAVGLAVFVGGGLLAPGRRRGRIRPRSR